MATLQKRSGSWRAIVRIAGSPSISRTFATKAAASAWAAAEEAALRSGKTGRIPDKTFGDLIERYRDEVSIDKGGKRWERVRIDRLVNGRPDDLPPVPPDPITLVPLRNLGSDDFAAWRDRRLRSVSAASVRREWTLLSHACTVAQREWKWLDEHPMKGVRRPAPPEARDRRISDDEIERLLFALGYSADEPPATQTARVGAALLFAIETAMRAGELVALRWANVHSDEQYLRVAAETAGARKTAAARRNVALSAAAMRILDALRPVTGRGVHVFGLTSTQTLDALFRRAKTLAMIDDLHFHDSRHEAITRLARKLDVLALARMVGHRDLRQLQVYYNEHARDIARRLG